MDFRTKHLWRFAAVFFCSVLLGNGVHGQTDDPLKLQASGIAKLDAWVDYARRTGDVRSHMDEFGAAQAELKASFTLFLQRQDYAGATLSAIKLGIIQKLMKQCQAAIPIFRGSAEMAAKQALRRDYQTTALSNLAFCELELGDAGSAEQHAREAVTTGANCGNTDFYFEALDAAANVEVKRGNLVAAGDYLDRALALARQVDAKRVYYGYLDRGDMYEKSAQACDRLKSPDTCNRLLELARKDYQSGLTITQSLGYTYFSELFEGFLNGLKTRGAMAQSDQSGAETLANTKLFDPVRPNDVLVTERFSPAAADPKVLTAVTNMVTEMRRWEAGLKQRGISLETRNPTDFCLEGNYDEMRGDHNAAIREYLAGDAQLERDRTRLRDEQARNSFLEGQLACFYRPALLLLDQRRYPEAFALFERSRSRAMADLIASRPLVLGTEQERALYGQLQTLDSAIGAEQKKLFNLTGSAERDQKTREIGELENKISRMQTQHDALETRITNEAPKLKELVSGEPVALADVQASAAAGGYEVLYYVSINEELVVWHIGPRSVEVKNVFLPHSVLARKAQLLRDSLVARQESENVPFDERTARQMYLYLVQPVQSTIAAHHLVLVRHEELNSIPFQVLQNPETGKYLGETFAITYAPSATVLAALATRGNLKTGRLLAVADPELQDAVAEVNAIGRLYTGRSRLAATAGATKAELIAWAGDYDLVHLSVHGEFNGRDPLLSSLQLREAPPDSGRLTAAEMFGLPLKKNSTVVLSACETGKTETNHANEEIGMVRSLLYAGAGRLVLSSWKVNAASTRLWMETFYRQGQSNDPAEAARLALLEVKSRPEYSHPFFWAPFVITGK